MKNDSQFFENELCQYFPCHRGIEHINCLFCYCPLYTRENCPGQFVYLEVNGQQVKDCSDCIYPHRPENYENIIRLLKSKNG